MKRGKCSGAAGYIVRRGFYSTAHSDDNQVLLIPTTRYENSKNRNEMPTNHFNYTQWFGSFLSNFQKQLFFGGKTCAVELSAQLSENPF